MFISLFCIWKSFCILACECCLSPCLLYWYITFSRNIKNMLVRKIKNVSSQQRMLKTVYCAFIPAIIKPQKRYGINVLFLKRSIVLVNINAVFWKVQSSYSFSFFMLVFLLLNHIFPLWKRCQNLCDMRMIFSAIFGSLQVFRLLFEKKNLFWSLFLKILILRFMLS